MCSIIVAKAIGVIVIIALILNLAIMIGGKATIDSLPIPEKSICPIARATKYEIITPKMIGTILAIPRPHILKNIIEAKATMARSQFVCAFLIADGASIKPIEIIIGPVTTGGKNFMTFSIVNNFISIASITYTKPATITPPQAYGSISVLG